jgi:hemoglobin
MTKYRTPYDALGEDGIQQLSNTFYEIMDELGQDEAKELRHMHANDLSGMKIKLAEYMTGWMGGPPKYADKYGTVCMTTPHEHYAIGPRERDQWLLCMEKAMDRMETEDEVREMLKVPLFRIADAVRNRQVDINNDNPDVIAIG